MPTRKKLGRKTTELFLLCDMIKICSSNGKDPRFSFLECGFDSRTDYKVRWYNGSITDCLSVGMSSNLIRTARLLSDVTVKHICF